MQQGATLFVGRGHELDQLRTRLERAFDGVGSMASIVGEPGIGKTSTTFAFGDLARARGATVLRGACAEGEWSPPLQPWAGVVRDLARALGPSRIVKMLGSGADALGAFVPELRGTEDVVSLGAREERFRLQDAVAQLLLRASQGAPLVMVLEDLHWADSDTVAMLRHVARFSSAARWVVVATYRESEIDPRAPLADLLTMLRRETDYQRIPLRGFALPEIAEYLTQKAGRELPAGIVRLIFDETVGNPFYVSEVLSHLLEEGKLTARSAGDSSEVGRRELGLPVGVREVVGKRLSRLSEDAVDVLSVASVLTGTIDFTRLLALCDLDGDRLRDCVDEAVRSGLFRGSPSETYELSHPIVRRTIYDGQNPDRRVRLHRRIALALDSYAEDTGDAARCAAEVAAQYHASSALPGAEQGVPHALLAAADAQRVYARDRAVTLLRLARDLASTAPLHVRVRVLNELARAEASAFLVEEACATAEAALHEMGGFGSTREEIADLVTFVARDLKTGGAPSSTWGPLVARGLSLIGRKRDIAWARLKLLEDTLETVASGAVHVVRSHARDVQATRVARERGDEDDYAGTIDYAFRTRAETNALVRLAKGWSSPTSIITALDAASRDLVYRHGAFAEARPLLHKLLGASERCGSVIGQARALVQLTHCEMALGEIAQARQTRIRGQAAVARLGATPRLQRIVELDLDTMFAYLLGGDWAAIAQPAARFAADPSAGKSSLGHIAAGVAVLGYALAGYAKESRSLLGHLAPVFERCDRLVYNYGVALDCALIAVWHLGATDFASQYRAIAEGAPPEVGTTPFSLRSLNVARMRALEGDIDRSIDAFARAREICDKRGMRPLRAIVDHDEGSALLRDGGASHRPRARVLLNDALAEFRALEMEPWITHAHQVLGIERPSAPPPSRRGRSRRSA